jgi:hypothetical protein
LDGKYNALVKNGVNVNAPDAVKSWIATRRDYILSQVAGVSSGFGITSNNGNNYTTNRNTAVLTGVAPVGVKTIRVNGVEYPVTWTSVTGWELRLALKPQQNVLRVEGYDSEGNPVPGASASITINVTTAGEAIQGRVVINEIQYNPAVPGSSFIELHNTARNTSYDLSGYTLHGVDFTFPPGSVITTNGFLVVAKDAMKFGEVYGFDIPVAGEFAGTLQNDGEAISLTAPGTNGVVLSAVRYSDLPPWPASANGTGGSLQVIDPTQDISRPANLAAQPGVATPGAVNSVRGSLFAFPTLWLNEVQPVNPGTIKDSAGQSDPWVELFNSGKGAVSLGGLYLTDDLGNLTKWPLPPVSLPAGQRLIIWVDGEPAQSTASEYHASFRINPQSGTVALAGFAQNTPGVFDYLSYDQLPAGQSWGAYPEGQAVHRSAFYKATPGGANDLSAPAVQVFINEWMAINNHTIQDPSDLAYDDWFELYNAGSAPADLSGYTLTDDFADPAKFRIPAGTVIPPHGFLLVWADSASVTNGSLHVNFQLSGSGESIGLYAPDGTAVDKVTFGAQQSDVSFGRITDGAAQIGALSVPTPGGPNTGVDPNALRFTGATLSGGSLTLTWNSEPGSTYSIQYKDNLADAVWTPLRSVTATGATASTTDGFSGAHRFYRIVKQ